MKKKRVICLMYSMLVGSMFAMGSLNISHAVGVVSGHMENLGEAVKSVHWYFRSTRITYKKGDRARHPRN